MSVVPAVYQSVLYGSENSAENPMREYANYLKDYIASAPQGANFAEQSPRVHGLFYDPGTGTGHFNARCNAGVCPKDLLTERLFPGDPGWSSHPGEESKTLFNYNKSYIADDKRVSYYSEK